MFGKLQLWRAAYHAAPPSPCHQHEAWLAQAATAPHVGGLSRRPSLFHRQRRRRRAKVVARCGSTHTQPCLAHGWCLVPSGWVCGWVLREGRPLGRRPSLLVAEVTPRALLDFSLPGLDEGILTSSAALISTLRHPSPPPIPIISREPSPCPAWRSHIPSGSPDDPLASPRGETVRSLEPCDTKE